MEHEEDMAPTDSSWLQYLCFCIQNVISDLFYTVVATSSFTFLPLIFTGDFSLTLLSIHLIILAAACRVVSHALLFTIKEGEIGNSGNWKQKMEMEKQKWSKLDANEC